MSILPAHLRVCLSIVILLFGGVVCAQEVGEPLSLLDVLDADSDGELSAREITRSAALIRRLDRDGNGKLTADELIASEDDADSDSDSGRNARASSSRNSRSGNNTASSSRGTRVSKASIESAINRAASYYMQKKYEEAGKQIEKAQELIEQLIDDDDLDTLADLADSLRRFERAHALLTEQDVDLPDLLDLAGLDLGDKPANQRASSARPRPSDTADAADGADEADTTPKKPGTVSFTKQVAPILVKQCGSCHVKDNKAELSFVSYSSLMAGSEGGDVVVSGNADSSFLVDMVESGDMPPEGDPVSEDNVKLIRTWIDEGAVFDGGDEEAKLSRS